MRKRTGSGKFKSQRDWNHVTRQINDAARREAIRNAVAPALAALKLCYTEITQFHHVEYPNCKGGCPAEEAALSAYDFIKKNDPKWEPHTKWFRETA